MAILNKEFDNNQRYSTPISDDKEDASAPEGAGQVLHAPQHGRAVHVGVHRVSENINNSID